MQEIADWLGRLGLGQYAQRFAENEIDVSVLPHLTDQDLKDIGIPLGHRRKILAAISEPTAAAQAVPEPSAASMAPKALDAAERRQVTVMFADLVGSTELSARMDPEDLRDIISSYQKCVTETVQRFDGFVARYMGDGVLAYFGYPQAHEDDAERAVRAGLDLIAGLAALKESVVLQVRVGIATGLVVVGDLIGAGEAQGRGIMTKAVLDAEGESEAPRDERVRALLIYQNQAARARQAFSALVSSEKSADWRGKLKRPCLFLEKVEWSGTSPSRPSRQNQR